MIYFLYFLVPVIFMAMALVVPPFVNAKIPLWMRFGQLSAEDIRAFAPEKRARFRNFVSQRCRMAFFVTLIVGFVFFAVDDISGSLILLCNILNPLSGIMIIMSIYQQARKIKEELEEKRNH